MKSIVLIIFLALTGVTNAGAMGHFHRSPHHHGHHHHHHGHVAENRAEAEGL